jgi:hypothetical protein
MSKKLLPDRRNAPRKTGKRGIGPLDPTKDFDNPVNKKAVAEAKGSLLAEQPPRKVVVGDRMEVFFERVTVTKPKDKVLVTFRCTVPLEKDHEKLLPDLVVKKFHTIAGLKSCSIKPDELDPCAAKFYMAHDIDVVALDLPAARLTGVSLAEIERTGEGTAHKVIRLSLGLCVPLADGLLHFAHNIKNNLWLKLEEANPGLFEELFGEDEEE